MYKKDIKLSTILYEIDYAMCSAVHRKIGKKNRLTVSMVG